MISPAEVQALVARHLAGMRTDSPPERACVRRHRQAETAGRDVLVGVDRRRSGGHGRAEAARRRSAARSSRCAWRIGLGRGVGRAMLLHIIGQARARGLKSLWLETGSTPSFDPALKL